ncbi:MAG TPA: hypothetical protein VK625_14830, partial [Flavitalea sp.]|nr:hypothetical protein [Flavitalea sp.]
MKRLLLVSLTCWIIPSISGQAKIDYFKDNTVRLNSVVVGSLQEGNSVYFWGGGTGYNPNMPILYKIDGQGPVKWHTANDTLLGLPGYFLSAFSDASYLYMIGYNVTDRNSRYFLAKVDKEQGRIVYIRDSIPLHVTGIMHWKDLGSEIRIISSTYDYQYYPNNKLPIVSTLLNKDNGVFSAPVDYGLPGLYPQFFDDADNVYYLSSQDSVMKYHVPSASIKWKSKIFTPDVLPSKFPSVTVKKENNLLFIMGNRYVWAFNDSVGNRLWDIKVPTYSNMDFYPYHVHFVKDSLYTSWSHPYSGSVTQFGLFAKINKNSGQIYYNGTVTDTGGIRHESEGYMTNPEFSVDDKGDIYMVSENTYSGDRKYKKLAGTTGRMIYQLPLVADQVITNNYNVISGIKNSRYSKTYFFDNSPYFLFHNNVLGDKGKSTTHINYYKFNPSIPVILEKNNFDNNYLQYPSSIIDIERYGEFTLVLKRQGQIAFVEKYTSEMNLEWQREITEGCPSRPEMLAVDSAGMICVLSYGGCGEMMALKGYQSTDYVNRVTILDQMGNIFSNTFPMVIAHDERLELIGIEAGFFAFGRDIR